MHGALDFSIPRANRCGPVNLRAVHRFLEPSSQRRIIEIRNLVLKNIKRLFKFEQVNASKDALRGVDVGLLCASPCLRISRHKPRPKNHLPERLSFERNAHVGDSLEQRNDRKFRIYSEDISMVTIGMLCEILRRTKTSAKRWKLFGHGLSNKIIEQCCVRPLARGTSNIRC